jgi:hypothetical protein
MMGLTTFVVENERLSAISTGLRLFKHRFDLFYLAGFRGIRKNVPVYHTLADGVSYKVYGLPYSNILHRQVDRMLLDYLTDFESAHPEYHKADLQVLENTVHMLVQRRIAVEMQRRYAGVDGKGSITIPSGPF